MFNITFHFSLSIFKGKENPSIKYEYKDKHLNSLVWRRLINILIGVGHDSVAMRVVMVTSPCTPSPLLWLLQLLLWFHNHGPQLTEAASPCPTPCSCSNQASRVICTRKTLEQVPDSISENTRYLNLQENTIQVHVTLSSNP